MPHGHRQLAFHRDGVARIHARARQAFVRGPERRLARPPGVRARRVPRSQAAARASLWTASRAAPGAPPRPPVRGALYRPSWLTRPLTLRVHPPARCLRMCARARRVGRLLGGRRDGSSGAWASRRIICDHLRSPLCLSCGRACASRSASHDLQRSERSRGRSDQCVQPVGRS